MTRQKNRDFLFWYYIALGVFFVSVAGFVFLHFLARYEASQAIIFK